MKQTAHLFLTAATAFAAASALAAEWVWDGGARGDGWNDIGNWVGIGVPAAGDSLRFPAGALQPSNNNDFPAGTSFSTLTYAGAGYTASGNEVNLTGGIVVSHGAGNTSLNLPISVAVNQTFTVSLAGANLYLNGAVELAGTRPILTFDGAGQTIVVGNISDSRVAIGGGTIRKNGAGTLWIFQHPTFGGPTIVNGGTLRVDGRMSNSVVAVNAGGTLRGTGKVGGLTANSGGTVGPGVNTPDILESLGDVALNAGSTFNVRLNGTSAGFNYDQLKVRGTVTLGGTLNVTLGFIAAVGDIFTLVDNDGDDDVAGTFAGLPEGAVFLLNGRPFKISYGGRGGLGGGFGRDVNDVTLEAVPALAVWDGGGGLNTFWSQPLNWVNDTPPLPGDDVQFANAGSGTLITSNDFPAGRVIGAMIFTGGRHVTGGNLAQINGGIQVNAGSDPIQLNQRVEMAMPLVLGASQTFEVNHSNAVLFTTAPIDLGNHNLMVESQVTFSYASSEHSQITILGGIGGQGTLIKNGPGNVSLLSASTCAHTIVNAGTFRSSAFYPSPMTGDVTVKEGAIMEAEDDIHGDVTVNTSGLLRGIFATLGGDVLVDGATFRAWPGDPTVSNSLRMINGSHYHVTIFRADQNGSRDNGAQARGTVELADCTLELSITTSLLPGVPVSILSHTNNGRTGTFAGLPDGTRFITGGYVLTIRYTPYGVELTSDETYIWDGDGSGNTWTTPANWVGDFAPVANMDRDLIFPANVTKLAMINSFPPGASFRSLTFNGPSYLLVGNSFQLTAGLSNEFTSGETTISADFAASGNPFECRVTGASRLRLEGSVTGNVPWRKSGTGTLRFAGTMPNSQSQMQVWEGELELDKSSGVDAISTHLDIGDGTNDVRVTLLTEHQIADTADVTIRNRARLDLNGNAEAIDRLSGEGTVSLDGRFVPGSFARLTVNSGSFSGAIVGNGGLTKTGSTFSTLALLGENTFSGMTVLSAGTLVVEGSQVNSPIRLDGGVLRGRGHVGTLSGNLGGIVQPGFSGAAFQNRLYSRDVAFNSSTTFQPRLTAADPGFENSQLLVAGLVNLGGCALSVDLLGAFKPTNGMSFLIIDNDGNDAIVGTFAGLPEGAVFGGEGLPFRITYAGGDGNDVVLTRVAAPATTLSSVTRLANGQIQFEGLGISGVVYPIQAASNLNPVILWTNAGSATGNASGIFQFLDPTASNRPMRFYRAVSP